MLECGVGRLSLALTAIILTGIGMHSFLAYALCIRGDSVLAAGGPQLAIKYYRRARWFDHANDVALDRLAFMALLSHRGQEIAAVLRDPDITAATSTELLLDRALLEQKQHEYKKSSLDFRRIARRAHSSRYMVFAALLGRMVFSKRVIRNELLVALRWNPHNVIALRSLRRLGSQ